MNNADAFDDQYNDESLSISESRIFDSKSSSLNENDQDAVERNNLCFSYRESNDETMTATLSLCGEVNLYGLEFELLMDTVGLSYKNVVAKTSGAEVNYNTDHITLSYVCDPGSNVTSAITLIEITFDITEANYFVEFSLSNVDAFDDAYGDETFTISENSYVK